VDSVEQAELDVPQQEAVTVAEANQVENLLQKKMISNLGVVNNRPPKLKTKPTKEERVRWWAGCVTYFISNGLMDAAGKISIQEYHTFWGEMEHLLQKEQVIY
jgi:hypothetical protein